MDVRQRCNQNSMFANISVRWCFILFHLCLFQYNLGNYFKGYTNLRDRMDVVMKKKSYFEKLKPLLERTSKEWVSRCVFLYLDGSIFNKCLWYRLKDASRIFWKKAFQTDLRTYGRTETGLVTRSTTSNKVMRPPSSGGPQRVFGALKYSINLFKSLRSASKL